MRRLIVAALATLPWLIASPSQASDYPSRPIKILIPFAAGGGTDILGRVLAKQMSENLGAPVIVENKAGGNTTVATDTLVRAEPDGYTLLLQTNNLAVNETLYAGKLKFSVKKNIAPVAGVGSINHVLVVNSAVPAKNMQEFIALAKKSPGKVTFASAGSGTVNHLAGEMLKILAGVDMLHIPYNSAGAALPGLLSGEITSMFAATSYIAPHLQTGKVRAMAVTSAQRSKQMPEVPTMVEEGFPGYEMSSWFGFVAPAGTPRPIIERLNKAVSDTLSNPAIVASLADYDLKATSPEEFGAFIDTEITRTESLIRRSGARID